MVSVSRIVAGARLPQDRVAAVALALAGIGTFSIMLRGPWGIGPFLLGLVLLAWRDRRLLVMALGLSIPLTTAGWSVEIVEISGRILDVRLAITFGVAVIGFAAVITGPMPRPSRLEAIFLALIGWSVVSGVLVADSPLTWAPPVARLVVYFSLFALARRHLHTARDLAVLMALIATGFAVPTFAGLVQFVVGQAEFINEAVRATAPGDRGPIALAFDGQMTLVLAFALLATAVRTRIRVGWLVAVIIGAAGLLVSATRLVTVTAWAVLVAAAALRRRWRTALAVTLFFGLALVARPDLAGRFFGTFGEPSPTLPGASPTPTPEDGAEGENVDASLRFRFFVWSTILEGWMEQPITGIGPGMTARLVAAESPAERTAPHNDYVGAFAELGVPGLVLFVLLQLSVLRGLYLAATSLRGPARDLVTTIGLLFVGTNVLGALNNPIYFLDVQIALWSLVGTALAVGAASSGYRSSMRSAIAASDATADPAS